MEGTEEVLKTNILQIRKMVLGDMIPKMQGYDIGGEDAEFGETDIYKKEIPGRSMIENLTPTFKYFDFTEVEQENHQPTGTKVDSFNIDCEAESLSEPIENGTTVSQLQYAKEANDYQLLVTETIDDLDAESKVDITSKTSGILAITKSVKEIKSETVGLRKSRSKIKNENRGKIYDDSCSTLVDIKISYCCKLCPYTASDKNDFTTHLSQAHEENVSNKRFQISTVNCSKCYICSKCSYKAAEKRELICHIKGVHEKVKDRKCKYCPFETAYRKSLKQHISAVHFKEKSYHCEECKFSATQKQNLANHIKTAHSDTREYQCKDCEYATNIERNLQRHQNARHNDFKAFVCGHCKYQSSRKDVFKRHLQRNHSNFLN